MQTASIQARLPMELKKKAELLFRRLGLDLSTAIRVFFARAVEEKKIPFEVGLVIHEDSPEEEEKFWNAMADDSLQDVWGAPSEDIWDEILPKLPSIREI